MIISNHIFSLQKKENMQTSGNLTEVNLKYTSSHKHNNP